MKKTTVQCARCGRIILPYRSVLPSNEAMDVCGGCAGAVWAEEVAELRAEIERLREGLQWIADDNDRNQWHRNTHYPTEASKNWHDGYITCSATHAINAKKFLDPEGAAEDDRIWRLTSMGTDAEYWQETGHCGGCGIVASSCQCDGECGCWELHGPPLKPLPTMREVQGENDRLRAENEELRAKVQRVDELAESLVWKRPAVSPCAEYDFPCCSPDQCDAMQPSVSVIGYRSIRAALDGAS